MFQALVRTSPLSFASLYVPGLSTSAIMYGPSHGGESLPRVKPSVPQCSCASEPSRVRKVPKNKQVKRTSLLFREIKNASTNDVKIARNSRDRSDVAVV